MGDSEEYQPLGALAYSELAVCEPDLELPGNFELLLDRLGMLVALNRSKEVAQQIIYQVVKEAKKAPVKYHEYVINEMQYELRRAKLRDNPDELFEVMINEEWAARLLQRFPADIVEKFINKLKKSRIKRDRSGITKKG